MKLTELLNPTAENAAATVFAGKPAPTKTCLYRGFVRDIYLAGEGGLESGASLSGRFAGKPAPTGECVRLGSGMDMYSVNK